MTKVMFFCFYMVDLLGVVVVTTELGKKVFDIISYYRKKTAANALNITRSDQKAKGHIFER